MIQTHRPVEASVSQAVLYVATPRTQVLLQHRLAFSLGAIPYKCAILELCFLALQYRLPGCFPIQRVVILPAGVAERKLALYASRGAASVVLLSEGIFRATLLALLACFLVRACSC